MIVPNKTSLLLFIATTPTLLLIKKTPPNYHQTLTPFSLILKYMKYILLPLLLATHYFKYKLLTLHPLFFSYCILLSWNPSCSPCLSLYPLPPPLWRRRRQIHLLTHSRINSACNVKPSSWESCSIRVTSSWVVESLSQAAATLMTSFIQIVFLWHYHISFSLVQSLLPNSIIHFLASVDNQCINSSFLCSL